MGAAKYEEDKNVDHWLGNVNLKKVHDGISEGKINEHPRILYFAEEKLGFVTFKGLYMVEDMSKAWPMDKGRRVLGAS